MPGYPPAMRIHRGLGVVLLAIAVAPQCTSTEDIRVRDRGGLIADARARWMQPVSERLSLGAEAGGVHTNGDYTSPTGLEDYTFGVGYAAAVLGVQARDAQFFVRAGPAWFDFAVAGQMRTLAERGLGGMIGGEVRYAFTPTFDAFGRVHFGRRSSLVSTWGGVGLGYHPTPGVALELGYGIASNRIDEANVFVPTDSADVETQGLMLGVTFDF